MTRNAVVKCTIPDTILGLLRVFLTLITKGTAKMPKETNGNDKRQRRKILMHNGKLRSWSLIPAVSIQRIRLTVVREDRQMNFILDTYDKWHIEGEFIITYTISGRRQAHKIPSDTKLIYERGSNNAPR